MPGATDRHDLITRCDRDFARLTVLLDHLRPDLALVQDADGWSIRDVIAQRTHWIHLTLGWARDGRAGARPAIPAPGIGWQDRARYDAALRDAHSGDSWTGVRQALRAAHLELMREIDGLDDAALYGGPMPGADSPWSTGRFLEACGPRAYRAAARRVDARIRLSSRPRAAA